MPSPPSPSDPTLRNDVPERAAPLPGCSACTKQLSKNQNIARGHNYNTSEEQNIVRLENKTTLIERDIQQLKERDIFYKGIEFMNLCSATEKMRAFVILYKLSEVDGHVHAKEIRLLLYSIKMADIEFNDLVREASQFISYF